MIGGGMCFYVEATIRRARRATDIFNAHGSDS